MFKKLKNNKAPGPDGIPMDWIKTLDQDNRGGILEIINDWWQGEEIPDEILQARVVHIYKKGDTSKYENYRPISLLNSINKIFAAASGTG